MPKYSDELEELCGTVETENLRRIYAERYEWAQAANYAINKDNAKEGQCADNARNRQ